MHGRIAILSPAERRIRREGHQAARREIALRLRREGKTLAAIAAVLGVSTTRVYQMVRKAERLIAERVAERDSSNEAGAPARERPSDFHDDPFAADRTSNEQALCVYRPSTT